MGSERKGLYHNDYSPRYKEPYNIYDKARDHIRKQKKERRSTEPAGSEISSADKEK